MRKTTKIAFIALVTLFLSFNKSIAFYTEKGSVKVPKNISLSGLSPAVYEYALKGMHSIEDSLHKNFKYLAVVDFSKPSTERRFYIIDLSDTSIVCTDYVCHGKYTGDNYATSFSNQIESNKSSLGFYQLSETYIGAHGLSIRMDGLDNGFNNNARKRAIVMHTADYANESIIKELGRFGRSLGCPTLPEKTFNTFANQLSNNAIIFHYYPDKNYLENSVWLHK